MKNKNNQFLFMAGISFISSMMIISHANAVSTPHKSPRGQLHGQIVVPTGMDPTSVVIQVIGAHPTDKFIYYTAPAKNGEFNFDGLLPADSVVQLYFWDRNGILERTILNAYVSPASDNVGVYQVHMNDSNFTQNLANIYQAHHDVTATGICGIAPIPDNVKTPIKISAYDRLARYRGPITEQALSQDGKFCIFGLNSFSGSDLYDFVFSLNDNTKTFSYYLPASTFIHNAFLDIGSTLYRPIFPFSWQENFFSSKKKVWEKIPAINIETSDDYSAVKYTERMDQDTLVYFPLENELVEVSYFEDNEKQDHFFTLIPRTKLVHPDSQFINESNKRVYVDHHPYDLKFVTESELIKLNANYYYQTWNNLLGSVFVNLDLEQFNVKNTADLRISIRNLLGQEVGTFEELITKQNNMLLGFFLNLLPGRYQMFLTDQKGQLLWTYEIRSYPNRIQVLTNESDLTDAAIARKKLTNKKIEFENVIEVSDDSEMYEETISINEDLKALRSEKILTNNSIFYKYDDAVFCTKPKAPSLLETLSALN